MSARPSELRQGYLHFARFFDRMADDLGNKLMSLNSLWNPHYFAKVRAQPHRPPCPWLPSSRQLPLL